LNDSTKTNDEKIVAVKELNTKNFELLSIYVDTSKTSDFQKFADSRIQNFANSLN
jgi:hypothetical protein